ncbi:hypothetical protein GCM10022237_06840 [Nocardioides ginsengisoli]
MGVLWMKVRRPWRAVRQPEPSRMERVVSEAEHRGSGAVPDRRLLLVACQAEVVTARARLDDARRRGSRDELGQLRAALLAALEQYAAAIERSGAPVPGRLGAELRLYRGLRQRW